MRSVLRALLAATTIGFSMLAVGDARAFVSPGYHVNVRWQGRYKLLRWRLGEAPLEESPNTFVRIDEDLFSWNSGDAPPYAKSPFRVRSVSADRVVMDFTEREGYAELRLLGGADAHLDYFTPTPSEFVLERVADP